MKKNAFDAVMHKLTPAQQKELLEHLFAAAGSEKNLWGILRGDREIILRDVLKNLVDRDGRCIPQSDPKSKVASVDQEYYLVPQKTDSAKVLGQVTQFFAPEMKFLSAQEFERQVFALVLRLNETRQVKNLMQGVHLPLMLPQLVVTDYGRTLEDIFLAAVERSCGAQFPGRKFHNHHEGDLAGKVAIVQASRHDQLIEAMRQGPVACLYFPTALQGFSIEASQQMIERFPQGFALSGAIDTAMAYAAYPQILMRNSKVPVSVCAANSWQEYSLCFRFAGDHLEFKRRGFSALGNYSGGIVFFG